MRERINPFLVFLGVNLLFVLLLSFNYNNYIITDYFNLINWIYLVLAVLGHYFSLILVAGIILSPLLFIKNLKVRTFIVAVLTSLMIILMYIDTIVFHQYRFHLNSMVMRLFFAGQVIEFPLVMYLQIAFYAILLIVIECLIYYVIQFNLKAVRWVFIKRTLMFFMLCILSSHSIHIWGSANFMTNITNVTKYLPMYYPTTSNSLMNQIGFIDKEMVERQKRLKLTRSSDLNYPKSKLITNDINSSYDIIFIVIESWRFDTFNKEVTPHIWSFSKENKSLVFNNHYSTGNSTRTGIFGLFYGLPGTYWHSFFSNGKSPVLMDRLQELDYQMGIFSSAQLHSPEFNKTVFTNIPNLRVESSAGQIENRDIEITEEWVKWYENSDDSKPSFSFLFYDSPHEYAFKKDYSNKFEPMVEQLNFLDLYNGYDKTLIFNRYKTSVHFTDSLIGQVIKSIDEKGKKSETLIIITGDHAQEMNDNNRNYWGHNSNFTKYQVQVPFIILAPDDLPTNQEWIETNVFTSHVDLAPTIMKNMLGVRNTIKDYSTGEDLFGAVKTRDWVFASNYSNYAILDKYSITEVGAMGLYEVLDLNNKKLNLKINFDYVNEALNEISSFYK